MNVHFFCGINFFFQEKEVKGFYHTKSVLFCFFRYFTMYSIEKQKAALYFLSWKQRFVIFLLWRIQIVEIPVQCDMISFIFQDLPHTLNMLQRGIQIRSVDDLVNMRLDATNQHGLGKPTCFTKPCQIRSYTDSTKINRPVHSIRMY